MSQWSHNHPEEMAEIAALPPSQQMAALWEAIGYDPDSIRDRLRFEATGYDHRRDPDFADDDPYGDEPEPLEDDE